MKIREAEILQAAAVAVAAPRYMGAFAYAIGINLVQAWGWFSTVEIMSGLAMALLEGWAVAFISRRWGAIPRGTHQHRVIGVIQAALLLMLPLTALPYLVGMNVNQPTIGIMPIAAIWGWEFVVAAVSPLIAAAVGYVDATVAPIALPVVEPPAPEVPEVQQVSRLEQVATLKAQNAPNRYIAEVLGVSVATVERDLKKLLKGGDA